MKYIPHLQSILFNTQNFLEFTKNIFYGYISCLGKHCSVIKNSRKFLVLKTTGCECENKSIKGKVNTNNTHS